MSRLVATALTALLLLVACGDDGVPADTGVGDTSTSDGATGDGGVMCIALGAECDGTVPCCAPNGCAGGMCGAPRDAGGDTATGDAATCANFDESCAALPCCEPSAQCVSSSMTCQPGKG